MLHVAALLLSAFALSGGPGPAQDQTLQVVPLPRDGEVLVSFKLGAAINDETRAAIQSGLTVKFVYNVDLRRATSVWFDRTIVSAQVTATVQYDTLTRRYHVSRIIDGRTEWADSTDREDAAWNALTSDFSRLALFHGVQLEPNAEYYIRVRAHMTPRTAAFIWPWQGDAAVGFAKFTFLR